MCSVAPSRALPCAVARVGCAWRRAPVPLRSDSAIGGVGSAFERANAGGFVGSPARAERLRLALEAASLGSEALEEERGGEKKLP